MKTPEPDNYQMAVSENFQRWVKRPAAVVTAENMAVSNKNKAAVSKLKKNDSSLKEIVLLSDSLTN